MSKYLWPSNPYKHERAQDLQSEREEMGLFRCERCDLLKPMPPKIEDGRRHCRRCSDPLFPSEAQKIMGEDMARAAQDPVTYLPYPVTSCFATDPIVTAISPLTLNLTRGGAPGALAITGVNLSASDMWSASNVNITVTPTVNSSISVSLSISAAIGTPSGDYDITFNGDTMTPRGILKVR